MTDLKTQEHVDGSQGDSSSINPGFVSKQLIEQHHQANYDPDAGGLVS